MRTSEFVARIVVRREVKRVRDSGALVCNWHLKSGQSCRDQPQPCRIRGGYTLQQSCCTRLRTVLELCSSLPSASWSSWPPLKDSDGTQSADRSEFLQGEVGALSRIHSRQRQGDSCLCMHLKDSRTHCFLRSCLVHPEQLLRERTVSVPSFFTRNPHPAIILHPSGSSGHHRHSGPDMGLRCPCFEQESAASRSFGSWLDRLLIMKEGPSSVPFTPANI